MARYFLSEYKGAAGPTPAQIQNNTRWLHQELAALSLKAELIPDPLPDAEGNVNDKVVKIGDYIACYDRWGFVVIREKDEMLVLDQANAKATVHFLLQQLQPRN